MPVPPELVPAVAAPADSRPLPGREPSIEIVVPAHNEQAAREPSIEVVVPVYNEQAALARSICRLHAFLSREMPFAWRIVIADNASTDATTRIARELARRLDNVSSMRLVVKGRGHALRAAWTASDADILCYMDVDLSTDLRALLPLVAALVSGHSDIAIGTRLAHGSRVVRGRKRELISRTYNHLLRLALRASFSDAQCGFKAVRADVARGLLPSVKDNGWFFDTELLVLAQRHGLRIHEVPVDWTDDPDSRVDIVSTAMSDLRGIARLLSQRPIVRFMAIGVLSTLAYAGLYVVLRTWLAPGVSNAVALAASALANTQANRTFTFGLRGRGGLLRQHAAGALFYVLALALTGGSLDVVQALDPHPARGLEVAALVLASAFATVTRYIALRSWVFARRAAHGRTLRPLTR
jgi:putative flippase GtrA